MREESDLPHVRGDAPVVLKVPARAIEPLRRFYALFGIAALRDGDAAHMHVPEPCDVVLRDGDDGARLASADRGALAELAVTAPEPEALAARCWDAGCTVLVDHADEGSDPEALVVVGPLGARVTIRRDAAAA